MSRKVMLATVVFALVAFISYAQADPLALGKPIKPPGGGLAECQAKVAELEATIAGLKAQIATLNASLKYALPKTGQTCLTYDWARATGSYRWAWRGPIHGSPTTLTGRSQTT